MSPNDYLWTVCETFYFPRKLTLRSEKTRYQYRCAVNDFERTIGHRATLADLDDDLVTVWMGQMLAKGLSPYTVRERAGRLLTLWNWLARRGVVRTFPTCSKPEAPEPQPVAWNREQLQKLFEAAQWEPGNIGGIPARHWWTAYLAWLWCTAERFGATMRLRWEWIDRDRSIAYIPAEVRKGRKKHAIYPLLPFVMDCLEAIQDPPRELVFPWPFSEGCYYYRFGRILRRAGLPDGRKHKTHAMRVSHATWRAALGGDPTKALLHSDPATTRRHYLDQRLLAQDETKLFKPW